MRHCAQCGRPLSPTNDICDECGALINSRFERSGEFGRFCESCGSLLPDGRTSCVICESKPAEPPPGEASPKAKPTGGRPFAFSHPSVAAAGANLTGIAFFIILLLICGIAAVGSIRFLPYILPGDILPLNEAVVYVKSDNSLVISFLDKEPYVITGKFILPEGMTEDNVVAASAEGRYIAYASASGGKTGLYLLDLSRLGKTEVQPQEGRLIADNITGAFEFSRKGDYLVYTNNAKELYVFDGKKSILLNDTVDKIIDVGDRNVLYIKSSTPVPGADINRFDVCLSTLDREENETRTIFQSACEILDYTRNFTTVLIKQPKIDAESGNYTFDVNLFDSKSSQIQTLATGVGDIIDSSAENRSLIFAKAQPYIPSYDELFYDGLEDSDKYITEPQPGDFGLPENYADVFEIAEDTDDTQAEEDIPVSEDDREEDEETTEFYDMYYDSYLDYKDQKKQYEDKLARDNLRQQARESVEFLASRGLRDYSIYIYSDGVLRELDENVFAVDARGNALPLQSIISADIASGKIAYIKQRTDGIPPIDLAGFDTVKGLSDFNLKAYLGSNIPQQIYAVSVTGESRPVYYGEDGMRIDSLTIADDGSGVYFLASSGNVPADGRQSKLLYYSPFSGQTDGEHFLIDTNAGRISVIGGYGGSIIYSKSGASNSVGLYLSANGGAPELVAEDVSLTPPTQFLSSGKTLIYYRNTSANPDVRGHGDLYINIIGKPERMIIGDVFSYDYRSDKLIYLERAKNPNGLYNLHAYGEGGVVSVDAGVKYRLTIGRNQ